MREYFAEIIGTMILVTLGDGVVANVCLTKSKGNSSGWIVITAGWGLAVAISVYCVGRISGAHLNPAVTIALATINHFPWAQVPGYVAAQLIGAMLGAVVVWLAYLPHWAATDDAEAKLGVFSSIPAIRSRGANCLTETIGAAVLVFGVLAIADNADAIKVAGEVDLSAVYSKGINPLLVGFLVGGIGLSLGGPTGYAINPARDLGPRIMHTLLPIPGKGSSDWAYSWVPIVGATVGGVLGALLHLFIV